MHLLDVYINFVRPLLLPYFNYVLGDVMSKLVFDAVLQYSHSTRFRQILEAQSLNVLTITKQRILSEDQNDSFALDTVDF